MSQCTDFREHIMKRTFEPLGRATEERLEAHLKSCSACLQFEATLKNINQIGENDCALSPRSHIKRELLKRMRSRHQTKTEPLFDKVRQFFTYRIALYQAAFVSLLILLLVFATPKLRTPHHNSETTFTPTLADTVNMNIINLQQIIQIVDSQKVGVNLNEDTVLAKILYTL